MGEVQVPLRFLPGTVCRLMDLSDLMSDLLSDLLCDLLSVCLSVFLPLCQQVFLLQYQYQGPMGVRMDHSSVKFSSQVRSGVIQTHAVILIRSAD